jgi:hypothetical protein
LQVYVSNVSVLLQVFYLDVAYVALAIHVCCKCFIWMLRMLQWHTHVWQTYVCKCFISFGCMLQQMLYVASVA